MAEPRLICPSCRIDSLSIAGRTERCVQCDGAWIHEEVLVGMLQEMTATALEGLPWEPRAATDPGERDRLCAVCAKQMQAVSLGHVALDRCPEHGVWFDAKELPEVLKHHHEIKGAAPHPGTDEKRRGPACSPDRGRPPAHFTSSRSSASRSPSGIATGVRAVRSTNTCTK
jgi:Zn-finger nucleic acid-binding protein